MPKPVSQLQRAQRPLDEQVLDFLAKDPANAFTALEIAAGVRMSSKDGAGLMEMALMMAPEEQRRATLAPWMTALAELEQRGDVQVFEEGVSRYYAYARKA